MATIPFSICAHKCVRLHYFGTLSWSAKSCIKYSHCENLRSRRYARYVTNALMWLVCVLP